MKVKSDLRAGMTFEECDQQRNYWKEMYQTGNCSAVVQDQAPPPPPPQTTPPPTGDPNAISCAWVNGVQYSEP